MGKAGGIIGIIAGILGFIAAVVTLSIGGLGSALEADGAKTVVGLGWGGVLFSFLAIVFGAVAMARPKAAGIGLIVVSILGAILGGTLVAICMMLSLIAGILAVVGSRNVRSASGTVTDKVATLAPKQRSSAWLWAGVGGAVVVVGVVIVGSQSNDGPKRDPLAELANAQPSTLRAEGELSELFALGSKHTDLQREDALKRITGQVVQWQLPVYEVSRSGDGYKVQTRTGVRFGSIGQALVGTFIYITPRNDAERRAIEALKTGDPILVKARIAGSSLRSLDLKPAILASQVSPEPHQMQHESVQQVQPVQLAGVRTDPSPGSSLASIEGIHPIHALEDPLLRSRLAVLLGESLATFAYRLEVAGDVERKGRWFVGTGHAPHSGGSDEAAFAVEVDSGAVVAVMLIDGQQLRSFGVDKPAQLPAPLLEWYHEHGGQ